MKTKNLKVKKIFANDGMFLANDGRLYRYQVKNGIVKAYKKSGTTDINEKKVYNTPDDRMKSDFWLINSDQKNVFFKKNDGSLEEIDTLWGTRAECHTPFVYGDLLFIITNFEWKNTNPYSESMEATYRIIRANLNRSGYLDITDNICSQGEKIIDVFCLSHTACELRLEIKDRDCKVVAYNRLFKTIFTEYLEWIEVELSENTKSDLL